MAVLNYVVGFMFDPLYSEVVLIRKTKPAWQSGLLNGVGGKVEPGEDFATAMRREFYEETGVMCETWVRFADVIIPNTNDPTYDRGDPAHNITLAMFRTIGNIHKCRTTTEEKIEIHKVVDVMNYSDLVPNLRWIIQMARSFQFGERAKAFEVREIHG
jgi:8-oxo-dGTP diphosphatase